MSRCPSDIRRAQSAALLVVGRVALLLLVLCCGCSSRGDRWSDERPPVYAVSGRVMLDGQPLAGAEVNFFSEQASRTAYGVTDAGGYFELTTFEAGDGAVAGDHRVKIRKVQISTHDDPNIDYAASLETAPPPETKWLIPEAYGDYSTSGLSAIVAADAANATRFELRSK